MSVMGLLNSAASEVVELTLDDRHNSTLLDRGRALETISVDTFAMISILHNRNFSPTQIFLPRRSSDFRFISSNESTVSSQLDSI